MDNSLRNWIPGLLQRQPQIIESFTRYIQPRLLRLARTLLRDVPNQESDEEDVVNAALHSFLWRMADEQFELQDEDDLWKVVQTIVARKASNHRRRQRRRRDHAPYELLESSGLETTSDPAMAMHLEDALEALEDDELRAIARLKLARHTNLEIAAKLNRSVATIERRLKLIRNLLLDRE